MGITVIIKEEPALALCQKLIASAIVSEKNKKVDSFNYCNTVHHEFGPAGQTVNRPYYLEVLKCVRHMV
jgi:hypothetical protein